MTWYMKLHKIQVFVVTLVVFGFFVLPTATDWIDSATDWIDSFSG